jgi:hypothetical protein
MEVVEAIEPVEETDPIIILDPEQEELGKLHFSGKKGRIS